MAAQPRFLASVNQQWHLHTVRLGAMTKAIDQARQMMTGRQPLSR